MLTAYSYLYLVRMSVIGGIRALFAVCGGRDVHGLTVFRDSAACDLDPLAVQCLADCAVAELRRFSGVRILSFSAD